MPPATSNGGYPQSPVQPELFPESAACNTALPVGEVIEWFDFGQFVELYATDTSGASHPLVLTEDDAVLQASLRVRDQDGGGTERVVDLSDGVPINRVVAGNGSDAFKTLATPTRIEVDDVDDLLARGTVTSNGKTYEMTLQRSQIQLLRDGESIVVRVREKTAGSTQRVWIQLVPKVIDFKITDLDQVLADRQVTVKEEGGDTTAIALKLEPLEIAALLADRTVVVRGTSGAATRLVRLQQRVGIEAGFATRPASSEHVIEDLAEFLVNPIVPGIDKLPFKVPLTAAIVRSLRKEKTAQVDLGEGRVLSLRLGARRT